MPMYEYTCHKCNAHFEEIAAADDTVPCPSCGSQDTERLLSACACFTGSGSGSDAGSSSSGGSCGCGSCSGGHCSSCGH